MQQIDQSTSGLGVEVFPLQSWGACNSGGPDRWRDLETEMTGRSCFGGLDIVSKQAINSLVWVFPPNSDDGRWVVIPRFFDPSAAASLQSHHDVIEAQVLKDAARFRAEGLGIDRFNAHSVAINLSEKNVPVELVPIGMFSMSPSAKLLERLVFEERVDHGGQPVLFGMAKATAIRRDRRGNYMPDRLASPGNASGIFATLVALSLASRAN
jgi:phage terminase large subunit-like protein